MLEGLKTMMAYLIIAAIFGTGYAFGAGFTWLQIRQYKRACGFDPDPLDGRELSSMEKFVEKHKDLVKEIDKATRAY